MVGWLASPGAEQSLRQNALDHFAGNTRQPGVQALELHRQTLMVDAEQVKHCGVEVVDADRVLLATDIEHIVALAEAYDSGLAESQFRTFAGDIDNLTIADPTVNRSQKIRP